VYGYSEGICCSSAAGCVSCNIRGSSPSSNQATSRSLRVGLGSRRRRIGDRAGWTVEDVASARCPTSGTSSWWSGSSRSGRRSWVRPVMIFLVGCRECLPERAFRVVARRRAHSDRGDDDRASGKCRYPVRGRNRQGGQPTHDFAYASITASGFPCMAIFPRSSHTARSQSRCTSASACVTIRSVTPCRRNSSSRS
jgi:hypothetical protein